MVVGPGGDEEPKIKRLSERYSVEVDCRLVAKTRSGLLRRQREVEVDATLLDLSVNGGALVTDHPIDDLTPGMRLTLIVDGCAGLIAVRRVLDVDGEQRVGVEFINLCDELEAALYEYIRQSRGNERSLENYWSGAV